MDAIPVIDLRLLTQAELNALAASSASSALDPRRADDIIVPKIDRSVFNESAGSRKQTYSRLRLAPPKAASSGASPASTSSRRRGRPRSTARALPENATTPATPSGAPDTSAALDEQERKDNEQIIQFLRQLFANNGRTENLTPPKLSLNPKPAPVAETNHSSTSAPSANGEANPLPENVGPTLDNVPPANAPKKRGRKKKLDKEEFGLSFTDTEGNDHELLNANDVPVDLSRLGEKENLFREELVKRTDGLVTEEEFLDYLTVLEGRWGSRRKRRKLVDAAGFGEWLPKGWKLLLGLKRQGRSVWLHCRRFISPSGKQFKSCKEISSYLVSLVGAEGIIKTDSVKMDENALASDNSPDASPAGPVDQASAGTETPSCSLSSFSKVENPAEVRRSSVLECQKCNATFLDQEGLSQHLLSGHQKSVKRCRHGRSITDGVIIKDGMYECQFCHKVFSERHRYIGHVGVHARSYSQSIQTLSNSIIVDNILEPSTLAGPLTVSEIEPTLQDKRLDAGNSAVNTIPIREDAASPMKTSEFEKAESCSGPVNYIPDPTFELSRNSSNSQVDNCNGVDEMKVDDPMCKDLHTGLSAQFDNSNINQTVTNAVGKVSNITVPDCSTDFTPFDSIVEKKFMVDVQQVFDFTDNRIDSGNISSEGFTTPTDLLVDIATDCNTTAEFSEPLLDTSSCVLADGKAINLISTEKETDVLSVNIEASEPAFDEPSCIAIDDKVMQLADTEKRNNVIVMKAESPELSASASSANNRENNTALTDSDKRDSLENDSKMTDSNLSEKCGKVECNEMLSSISSNGSYYRTGQKLGNILDSSNALHDACAGVHFDPETKLLHAATLDETGCLFSLDSNPQDLVNVSSTNAAQSGKDCDISSEPCQNATRDLALTNAGSPVSETYTRKLVSPCNPEIISLQTAAIVKIDPTGNHAKTHVLANESSADAGYSNQVINTCSNPSPDKRGLTLTNAANSVGEPSNAKSVVHSSPENKMAQAATVAESDLGSDFVNPQELANKLHSNILESSSFCFNQSADIRCLTLTDSKSSLCETSTGKSVSHVSAKDLTNNITNSIVRSIVDSDISLNQSLDVRNLELANVGCSLSETSVDKGVSFNSTKNQGKDNQNEDKLNSDCHLARLSATWPNSSENELFSSQCLEEIDNSLCEHQFFLEQNLTSSHAGGASYQIHTGDNNIICEGVTSHESLSFDCSNKQDTHPRNEMVANSENVECGRFIRLEGQNSSHPNCLGALSDNNQNHGTNNQTLAILPSDVQNSTAIKGPNSRLGGELRYSPDGCKDDCEEDALENVSANTYPWVHSSNFLSMSTMSDQDAEKLYYINQKHNYTDFEGVKLENFNSSNPIVMPNQVSQFMPEVQINLTGNRELGNVFESSIHSDWDVATASLGDRHHQLSAVCIWCGSAFNQQGINQQTQQESIGFICSSCKSKFSVQLKF